MIHSHKYYPCYYVLIKRVLILQCTRCGKQKSVNAAKYLRHLNKDKTLMCLRDFPVQLE